MFMYTHMFSYDLYGLCMSVYGIIRKTLHDSNNGKAYELSAYMLSVLYEGSGCIVGGLLIFSNYIRVHICWYVFMYVPACSYMLI